MHCFRASLSEQDLERLWGASGRAVVGWSSVGQGCGLKGRHGRHVHGFLRTMPSWEKYPLPSSSLYSGKLSVPELERSGHGVASSCASMISSMLASPHGASEQYMCSFRSSLSAKGWEQSCSWTSDCPRRRRKGEEDAGEFAKLRHS